MADIGDYFRKAERIEVLAAELYRLLARGMPRSSNAREVLLKLAQEEDEHAMRVRMLQGRYQVQGAAVAYDTSAFDKLIEEGETLKRLLSAEPAGITREEARRFMIEQERHFGVAHAHVLVSDVPELAGFFADLAWQDQTHIKVLEQIDLER